MKTVTPNPGDIMVWTRSYATSENWVLLGPKHRIHPGSTDQEYIEVEVKRVGRANHDVEWSTE